jgi:putative hemolysin
MLVEKGVRGSRRALALASDPGKFLSTVQIGITLIGVLSGAFSGATLGLRLTAWLVELGLSQGLAEAIGLGVVVTIITYASLIVGELVPKQIALRDPEAVAVSVAPYMVLLSKISLPLVWLLDRSGKVLLWLLGQRGEAEVESKRRRNPDFGRRSRERRRPRATRKGNDRGRHAPRRPSCWCRDDPTP